MFYRHALLTARLEPRPALSVSRRLLSLSAARRAVPTEAPNQEKNDADEIVENFDDEPDVGDRLPRMVEPLGYRHFMANLPEDLRVPRPRSWLGGRGTASPWPFPMNKSFCPPPPISDTIRNRMYEDFMRDPRRNSVRALAQRFHLSMKRVDAILRLKGMEKDWEKGNELQTGFRIGMEYLLGVKWKDISKSIAEKADARDWDRIDVDAADQLEEEENRDAQRQRYVRLYWESVPEDGSEPIVPASVERAKADFERNALAAERHKADHRLMPLVKDKPTMKRPEERVQVIQRQNRADYAFVDVGAKFMDVEERLRRMAASERRRRKATLRQQHRKPVGQRS